MPPMYYHFRVGQFSCVSLHDGTADYPAAAFFANANPAALAAAWDGPPPDVLPTAHNCLFVDTGAHRVLIDTGPGVTGRPGAGWLLYACRLAGVDPASIDTVILSHTHPDHVMGLFDDRGHLAFPAARLVLSTLAWEAWLARAGEIERALLDLLAPRFAPVEVFPAAIVPGIQAALAPGHAPGQVTLTITGGPGAVLHYAADVIAHPLHAAHPAWHIASDADPALATQTRRAFLAQAAQDQTLVFGYHCPFPGLGHIQAQGDAWEWVPLTIDFSSV